MNITVNVDEISLDTAVASIVRYDGDDSECIAGERTVADLVAELIVNRLLKDERYGYLRDNVLNIRKEVIREALVPAVEEAMTAAFCKTNNFGEAIAGTQTTMREVIADEAKKLMTEPADNYHRDKGTRLQVMVRKEVEAALGAEIASAVKAAREQVSAEIGQMVATAVQAGLKAR